MTDILDLLRRIERIERELEALQTIEPPPTVAAKYRRDSYTTINDATWTRIDFDDEEYDTHDAVTTGASWKFTAPIAGYYHVEASALIDLTTQWAENEVGMLAIRKNGTTHAHFTYTTGLDSSGTTSRKGIDGSIDLYLAANDYIDIWIYQASGAGAYLWSTDSYYNWVCITKWP